LNAFLGISCSRFALRALKGVGVTRRSKKDEDEWAPTRATRDFEEESEVEDEDDEDYQNEDFAEGVCMAHPPV